MMPIRTLSFSLLVGLGACGAPAPGGPGTLTDVKITVFKASCNFSSCHDATSHQGGLDLVTDPYTALVNAPTTLASAKAVLPVRVTPGDVAKSLLYKKVTLGTGSDSTFGLKMPNTGQAIDANQLHTLTLWIMNGALKD